MSIIILYVDVTQDICLWNLGQKNPLYFINSSAGVPFCFRLAFVTKKCQLHLQSSKSFLDLGKLINMTDASLFTADMGL